MRDDIRGVGGFFEDLPVLVFVLAGVSSVLSCACWSISSSHDASQYVELEREARRVLDSLMLRISEHYPFPSLLHIESLNMTGMIEDMSPNCRFSISIWMIHPTLSLLNSAGGWDPDEYSQSASASDLINIRDEHGMIGIGDVRVVAWSASV